MIAPESTTVPSRSKRTVGKRTRRSYPRPFAPLSGGGGRRSDLRRSSSYLQPLNLKEPIRVAQLPITARSEVKYSFVYQKVHWSVGSTVRSL
jgi:hypothetical protein